MILRMASAYRWLRWKLGWPVSGTWPTLRREDYPTWKSIAGAKANQAFWRHLLGLYWTGVTWKRILGVFMLAALLAPTADAGILRGTYKAGKRVARIGKPVVKAVGKATLYDLTYPARHPVKSARFVAHVIY